jgi:hypothetical protein
MYYEGDELVVDARGEPDPRGRRVGACLDVRASIVDDPAIPDGWREVYVEVGNRCRRAVYVDLRHVRVTETLATGQARELVLYDPEAQVSGAVLDGNARGREWLAFAPLPADGADVSSLCIDVARVTAGRGAPPICADEVAP